MGTAKRRVGRPTKYKPEYCQKLVKYFTVEPFSSVEMKTTDKRTGRVYMNEELRAARFPTLEKFATDIGVDTDTLLRWSKAHKEFRGAITRAKHLQKDILVTNGLLGLYNPSFSVFVGTNFTDMRQKTEIDQTVREAKPLLGGKVSMPTDADIDIDDEEDGDAN